MRKKTVSQDLVEIQLCWGTGRIHPKSSGVHPDILAQAHASWKRAYKCARSPRSKERGVSWSWLLDDWSVVMRFNPANKLRNCYIKKVVSPCGVVFRWPEDEDAAMDFAKSQQANISDDDPEDDNAVGDAADDDDEEEEEEEGDEMPTAEAGLKRNRKGNGTENKPTTKGVKVRLNWGTGAIHNDYIQLEQTALDHARNYWESRRAVAGKANDANQDNWSWIPSDWDLLVDVGRLRASKTPFSKRMVMQNKILKYMPPCGAAFSDREREEAKVFAAWQKRQGKERKESESSFCDSEKESSCDEEIPPTVQIELEEDGDLLLDGEEEEVLSRVMDEARGSRV